MTMATRNQGAADSWRATTSSCDSGSTTWASTLASRTRWHGLTVMRRSSTAWENVAARCCRTIRTVFGANDCESPERKACTSPLRIVTIWRSPKWSTAYRSFSVALCRVLGRHTPSSRYRSAATRNGVRPSSGLA
ncbi:MAG: hypothetical protein ABIS47_08705 [Acidimicrobiales bacterium]